MTMMFMSQHSVTRLISGVLKRYKYKLIILFLFISFCMTSYPHHNQKTSWEAYCFYLHVHVYRPEESGCMFVSILIDQMSLNTV